MDVDGRTEVGIVKILVVAPSWIGDLMMAQALLITLKTQQPQASISVAAPAWSNELLQLMPEVDEILPWPFEHGALDLRGRWRFACVLKKHHFDQAYILPNSWKSALPPALAGIPQRIAYLGEGRYGLLSETRHLNKTLLPRTVDRFVALAYPQGLSPERDFTVPLPHLQVDEKQRYAVLQAFDLTLERPVCILCPGAAFGPAKQWPTESFAELAQRRVAVGDAVWILGSMADQVVGQNIQHVAPQARNLCGETTLKQAAALLSCADQVVCNDSGLMHMACALGCPTLVLYGSSSVGMTPPLSEKARVIEHDLPCRPCFQRRCPRGDLLCLHGISVDEVLEAWHE